MEVVHHLVEIILCIFYDCSRGGSSGEGPHLCCETLWETLRVHMCCVEPVVFSFSTSPDLLKASPVCGFTGYSCFQALDCTQSSPVSFIFTEHKITNLSKRVLQTEQHVTVSFDSQIW